MRWNILENTAQLTDIEQLSMQKPVLIFKHSTSCSISSTSLNRLERVWKDDDYNAVAPYLLNLLQYRSLSNEVAARYGVEHESPQAIVIHNGKAVYHASHWDIAHNDIVTIK